MTRRSAHFNYVFPLLNMSNNRIMNNQSNGESPENKSADNHRKPVLVFNPVILIILLFVLCFAGIYGECPVTGTGISSGGFLSPPSFIPVLSRQEDSFGRFFNSQVFMQGSSDTYTSMELPPPLTQKKQEKPSAGSHNNTKVKPNGNSQHTVQNGENPAEVLTLQPDENPQKKQVAREILLSYFTIAAFLIGGILLGLIVERLVRVKLRRMMKEKGWDPHEDLLSTLKGIITFVFVMLGLNLTIIYVPMSYDERTFVQKAVLVGVIMAMSVLISRVTVVFLKQYIGRMSGIFPSASLLVNITQLFIMTMGTLIMLHSLGISITPILTAMGVGGIAVALALQDTLSNLFSGLYILATKEVEPGEYVKIDSGEEGYVVDITWRNTTIRSFTNNTIIIPNSKFASSVVTNVYRPSKDLNLYVEVDVSYNSDLEYVEKVTLEVARQVLTEVKGGSTDFEPEVRFHTFGDSSIDFTVVLRIEEIQNQYHVKSEFIKRLFARYKKENIDIPFPVRTVLMNPEKSKPAN